MLSVDRLLIGQARSVGSHLETASMWQEQEVMNRECYLVKYEPCLFLSLSTQPVNHLSLSKQRFFRLCHVFNLKLEGIFSALPRLSTWLFGGKMTQKGAGTGNGAPKKGEELKIVIVGDGGCGKTSLLMVYAKGDFPEVRRASLFLKEKSKANKIN